MTLRVDGHVRRGGFELRVDVAADPGEVVAVLGPNGAGKSTLLRVVAGLQPLDGGTVRVGSTVVDDIAGGVYLPPQRRRIGVVFQDHRLFAHLRVVDNVAFGPRSRGVGRSAARSTATDWLARLSLDELGRRYPRQLSGGQAQRVALARALACDPAVLLLDEPLAALDVQTRAEVQGELREHLGAFAGPTLLVTHDPIEALLLATRIVVLERGGVVQQGTPAEITGRPLTPYVARLVGMNLYEGTASAGVVAITGGGSLVAPAAPDGAVLAALRPSAITVHGAAPGPASARNRWRATVAALAPLGDRVRVTTVGELAATVDVTAAAVAELGLAPGREVWLSAKATDVSAYPAPSR
ncbi:molybdate transport system ATP-binding protein [Jatrophihabitans endophyticus]|uniref:Molybdate transport system ATP-binding protein n=1 Tax=Jatrophihabitans endophyticus TaxID=1206085 RepID=A0A1M5EDC0_9ACTN|nr:molybdate transport system ATP-binding protein [Jatrophihabitans endophyticus]